MDAYADSRVWLRVLPSRQAARRAAVRRFGVVCPARLRHSMHSAAMSASLVIASAMNRATARGTGLR